MKSLFAATAAAATLAAAFAVPSVALAGDDRHGWSGYRGGYGHYKQKHYRPAPGYAPRVYYPAPRVYYPAPRAYYPAPQVVYPAPVVVAPPPVAVYPRPYPPVGHVSIGFGFQF
jgi:hypothetical protein